jgi:hypothetical protein
MTAYSLKSPMMDTVARTYPKSKAPVSPIKILADCGYTEKADAGAGQRRHDNRNIGYRNDDGNDHHRKEEIARRRRPGRQARQ